jgi:uncharacterized cupredoxin-like copper-binding protein
MGTAATDHRTDVATPAAEAAAWWRVLVWTTAAVAVSDVVFMSIVAAVIPPFAVGAALTLIGILLLRRMPRTGIVMLGVLSVAMLLGSAPGATSHLPHPESAIDFTHAVVGLAGRAIAMVAALGAWRKASVRTARRLAAIALALAAATVAVAATATLVSSGAAAAAGDLDIAVERAAFPEDIEVDSGTVLFVDNQDPVRHTFTVAGTRLDVELPARQGARVPIDLAPGSYAVICDVPGHEFMTARLQVR